MAAGICIRQKTKASKLDLLEELVRGFGMDPERVLVKDAISEAHRGVMAGKEASDEEATRLWAVLKDKVLSELKGENSRRSIRLFLIRPTRLTSP